MYKMLLIAVLSIASLQAVRAQCTATITALGPTTFCAPGSVTLKASPGNVYRWYKNGNYIALLVCDTFTVHTSGSYSVVVDAGGCIDTSAGIDIVANSVMPQPVVHKSGTDSVCLGSTFSLWCGPADSYQWYRNDTLLNGEVDSFLITAFPGQYKVLVDSQACPGMSAAKNIIAKNVLSQPGPITGPDTACVSAVQTYSIPAVPGALKYLWGGISTQSAGGSDTTLLPTITGYPRPANFGQPGSIVVMAVNECGLSPLRETNPTIVGLPDPNGHWSIPKDVADNQVRVCPGTEYTLYPLLHGYAGGYTDSYTYQWCLNNTIIPGATNREYIITHGGNYSVRILTSHCGTMTVPKKVYQDIPNSITITPAGPLTICNGQSIPLKAVLDLEGVSDQVNWTWSTGSQYVGKENTLIITPEFSGNYSIVANSKNLSSCRMYSQNSVSVTIAPSLTVTQAADTLIASPGFDAYQWFEDGVLIGEATDRYYVPHVDGSYFVEGSFAGVCIQTSDSVQFYASEDSNKQLMESSVLVFPNPTFGRFTVKTFVDPVDNKADIAVLDLAGKVLYKSSAEVRNGIVEKEVFLESDIARFCIVKVRSKHTNKTAPFYIRN